MIPARQKNKIYDRIHKYLMKIVTTVPTMSDCY
jgi:hypothetical protein